jgi:hypothetical protein
MTYQDALKDYVEVKDRIQEFIKTYPEGSLQFEFEGTMDIAGQTIIWGRAYAYREKGDLRPGIGTAWELVPGKSPFTRGSELMVLETSAWGRAIAALGIAVNKSVASKQEVQAAQERDPWANPPNDDLKPEKADLSLPRPKVIENYHETPEGAKMTVTTTSKGGVASTKQVNFLRVIFGKGWNVCGYSPEPTEADFVDWFSNYAKTKYESREEFEIQPVKEMLDNQNLIVEAIKIWKGDSSLWKDEAF